MKYIKDLLFDSFVTIISVVLGLAVIISIMLIMYPRGQKYDSSFEISINELKKAEMVTKDQFSPIDYSLDGKLFHVFMDFDMMVYRSNGNLDPNGAYLTEDVLTPGDPLYYYMNDDVGMIFFEIKGLPIDDWLMLCRDYGKGNYYWIQIYRSDSVSVVPQIIDNLRAAKRYPVSE